MAARIGQAAVGQAVGQQQRLDQGAGAGRLVVQSTTVPSIVVVGSGAPVVKVSTVPRLLWLRRRSVTPGSSSTR